VDTITVLQCTGRGTTAIDWIHPLDQGYTACCNEPVDYTTAAVPVPTIGCATCGQWVPAAEWKDHRHHHAG